MGQQCIKCSNPVASRDGYENSIGETLCDPCYGILWSRERARPTLAEQTMRALRRDRRSLA